MQRTRSKFGASQETSSYLISGSGFEALLTPKMIEGKDSIITIPDISDKHNFKDNNDVFLSRNPSYTKFNVPYKMICKRRYSDAQKRYEDQIQQEILKYIDYHATASEACFLVRCMAITSLWPPLYSRKDLRDTGHHFFRLKPKEKSRLRVLMKTNII